jgi:hypothetical protein
MKGWHIIIIVVLIAGYLFYFRPDILNTISGKVTGITKTLGTTASIGTNSIKDITHNLQNYEGKKVTVTGAVYQIIPYYSKNNGDIDFKIVDNEAYFLLFKSCGNRFFTVGETYTIKGTFMKDIDTLDGSEIHFIIDEC